MAYNENESSKMILSTDFFFIFDLLPAFMNFYFHLVSMTIFIQKLTFSFIWVENSFNAETNLGKCCNNQIKLNFTDILAVDKEWLFHGLPWQPLFH